jgi:DNA polymerase-1
LQQVAERHLGLTLDKSEQRSDWSGALSPQQLRYAAQDAAVLLKLATALSQELETAELARVADIEYACIPALAWLELAGLPVDSPRWRERAGIEKHRAAALEAQLHTIVTQSADHRLVTVNWRSAQQVKHLLLARGHRVKDTASSTLSDLPDGDPLIPTLLAFRDASKRASTYGEKWLEQHLHPVTGRIHADYLQLGAMSGRMSCTKPNVQNLPRSAEYRGSIQPEPGRCLIKADFSQIELRLAAIIAGENAMISAFQSGHDLHTVTAARLLGIDLAAVTKDHRQLAKALNFGLLYGMGAERLQAYARQNYKVAMSPREAAMHRRRFFDAYPDLKRWHQKRSAKLRNAVSIETRTMTGRRRLNTSRYTESLNTPVQGTGADGLKAALGRLFVHRHEVPEARLVACVHDEVVAECPVETAEQTAQWLNRHMTTAMRDIVGDAVPIVAETVIGQDWYGTPLT